MTISSAYLFAKQIKAGVVPPDPITVFENGTWNNEVVSNYYQPGGASAPEAPGAYLTVREATNLYALGTKYQNLYTMNQTNISRSCTTGSDIDQSGCSVFVPFNNLVTAVTQIITEYKITNAKSFTQLTIAGIRINGDAYETIEEATGSDTDAWKTLTVTLSEPTVLDAIEIQSTYGSYEIRKITIQ